jgi:hypothetical protein
MSERIYHQHHIIPRHAGGTNDPSNLIRLSIPEHADAHRVLWEQYGRVQDKVAWLGLSGMTSVFTEARMELYRAKLSAAMKGKRHSVETRAKISTARKAFLATGVEPALRTPSLL